MRRLKILIALFCFGCLSLRGEDYHVSLICEKNGDFKFFVMRGSREGYVKGVFRNDREKQHLEPEPEMQVTISGRLRHFFKSYGIVTFEINGFWVKIESDRSVFLWGADKEDRVYLYTNTNFRKVFRLDFAGVRAPVFFRTNGHNFEWIEADKCGIPSPEISGKNDNIPNSDGKKQK